MDMCICSFLFVYIDTYTYRACTCNFIQSISWYTMIIRWSCHVWVRWQVLCAPGSLLSDASAMANVRCSFGTPVPQRGRPYSMDTRIWLAKLRRWGSGICLDAGWCWRMDDQKAVGSGFCLGLNLSLLGEACRSRGIGNWHWAGLMIPPWSFGISRQGGSLVGNMWQMCLASTKKCDNAGENVANMLQKNWFTGAVGNICNFFLWNMVQD